MSLLMLQLMQPACEHLIMFQALLLELTGSCGIAFCGKAQRGHGFGIIPDAYLGASGLKSENG